ncbi:MAG: hypothetical protein LUD82_01515 [Clostridiales bacterium]|nr:hypothetical protein [Clostridiales bacterium]
MKLSNNEMAQATETMSGLKEKGKLGYAIARNTRKLRDAAKEYLELRNTLFQKYGHSVGGNRFVVDKDKLPDFLEELNADGIPAIEHEVDVYQVDEDTFISGSLDSQQMAQLFWMVKED